MSEKKYKLIDIPKEERAKIRVEADSLSSNLMKLHFALTKYSHLERLDNRQSLLVIRTAEDSFTRLAKLLPEELRNELQNNQQLAIVKEHSVSITTYLRKQLLKDVTSLLQGQSVATLLMEKKIRRKIREIAHVTEFLFFIQANTKSNTISGLKEELVKFHSEMEIIIPTIKYTPTKEVKYVV